MKNVSAPCDKNWLPSFSSLPLAGETTEGEAGCQDFFRSLLKPCWQETPSCTSSSMRCRSRPSALKTPTPACGSAFSAGSESLFQVNLLLSNHPALLRGRCSGHEL